MNKLEFIKPTYSAVKSVNGMTGDVVIEVPEAEVDLTGYATEEYVAKKIAEAELAEGDVDLSAYYTKSETDTKIDEAIAAIDIPEVDVDLTGYATEQFVNDAISTIELTPGPQGPKGEDGYTPVKGVDYFDGAPGEPGKDGSDYVLTDEDKAEIAGMVEVTGGGDVDLTGYATEQYVTDAIAAIDIQDKVRVDNATIVKDSYMGLKTSFGGSVIVKAEYGEGFDWAGEMVSDTEYVEIPLTEASYNKYSNMNTYDNYDITIVVNGVKYNLNGTTISKSWNAKDRFNKTIGIDGSNIVTKLFYEYDFPFSKNYVRVYTAPGNVISSLKVDAYKPGDYSELDGFVVPVKDGLKHKLDGSLVIDEDYLTEFITSIYSSGEEVSY